MGSSLGLRLISFKLELRDALLSAQAAAPQKFKDVASKVRPPLLLAPSAQPSRTPQPEPESSEH